MLKKNKFKPRITRVQLNPEQAVLACTCATTGAGGFTTGTANFSPQPNQASYVTFCNGAKQFARFYFAGAGSSGVASDVTSS